MLDITIELNSWIEKQSNYQAILQRLDLHTEAIIWSDDLAIPWLTGTAAEMPTAIETLLQQVHRTFTRRGFELNMQKGKTTAVITFRGPGAPDLRRKYQLGPIQGIECSLAGHQTVWLHIVPSYKHLGIHFSADGGIQG